MERLEVGVKSMERIHRLGGRTTDQIRPIIMKLGNFTEKKEVLKNARKLKGSNIFINEDFCLHVRTVRKKLWDSAKTTRDGGEKTTLIFD